MCYNISKDVITINKLYARVKQNIKENYKYYISLFLFVLVMRFEFNYEIYSPGGLVNLDERVTIEGGFESEGSINMTYVGGKKGILPFIILSYIIPNWDLVALEESQLDSEDYDDIYERGRVLMYETGSNAIISAFKAAGKSVEVLDEKIVVLHIQDTSENELKIGDEILEVENKKVNTFDDIKNILDGYKKNDEISIVVLRKEKEKKIKAILKEGEEGIVIGVFLTTIKEVKTSPEVKLSYKSSESGPSGGLMTALEIYNKITEGDITKGEIISGTGTIDENGIVGDISGVKYKLKGAVNKKAKVFIAPSDNYKEALSEKEKYDYDITIIEADTLLNVIQKLKDR